MELTLLALPQLEISIAEKRLIKISASSDTRLRVLSISALGHLRSEAVVTRLLAALEDRAWPVRRAAIDAIEGVRTVEVVDALLRRLDKERAALLPAIYRQLIALTGQDFGPKPGEWREYWDVARGGFAEAEKERIAAEKSSKKTFVLRADEKKAEEASYFGVEIVSRRLAFIIDCSGSMAQQVEVPTEGGDSTRVTKLHLARNELLNALTTLDKGVAFSLVSFNTNFQAFTKKPVKMGKSTFRKARRFVESLNAGGATNLYDSLESVLQAGDIDTVFLLSDGEPTAGKHTGAQRILDEIQRLNAGSQVTVHTIALGYQSDLLRRLSKQNRGEYVVAGKTVR